MCLIELIFLEVVVVFISSFFYGSQVVKKKEKIGNITPKIEKHRKVSLQGLKQFKQRYLIILVIILYQTFQNAFSP